MASKTGTSGADTLFGTNAIRELSRGQTTRLGQAEFQCWSKTLHDVGSRYVVVC